MKIGGFFNTIIRKNKPSRRVLVTSALPYVNGVKHLGNLSGSILPADIYARYLKQQGVESIYICGIDEHGTPAELAALKENLSPEEYCNRMYKIQKDIYEKFDISFDFFGRTSSEENIKTTQEIFNSLDKNSYISVKEMTQWFDPQIDRFLPDRFIEGTCPECGAENARGDQCDTCLTAINVEDLKNPRSKITGNTNLEKRRTKHLFFNLDKLQKDLSIWIKEKESLWAKNTIAIAKKWIKEGLNERCITRDLKWGVPVPKQGFEDKVFYVWFDAPIGYISITKQLSFHLKDEDLWKRYWKQDTKLVQFMGKDNVFFHTIIWPALLIGSKLGYTLPSIIKSFEFLTYEGQKFSTSKNVGIFLDDAIEEFSSDYWRYYLTSIIPERSDSNFSWSGMQQSIGDLANSFGNFNNRVLKFINSNYNGVVPEYSSKDRELWDVVDKHIGNCSKYMEDLKYKNWFHEVISLWNTCDKYLSKEEPWKKDKDSDEVKAVIGNTALLCKIIASVSFPLIPNASKQIFKQLNLDTDISTTNYTDIKKPLPKQHRISKDINPIFIKIDDKRIEELKSKYGG